MATRVNKAAEKKYSETTERSGRITKHPVLKGVGVFCLCAVAAAAGTYFGIKYNHTDTVAQNMQDDTHYVQDDNSDRYENPSTGNGDANSADDAENQGDSSKPNPDLDPNRPSRPDPTAPINTELSR